MELLSLDSTAETFVSQLESEGIPSNEFTLISNTPNDQGKFAKLLVDSGFVVFNDENDLLPLELASQAESPRYIGVCYLILTDGCNMRCRYCFENVKEPKGFHSQRMSTEIVESGIQTFARLSNQYRPTSGHVPKLQLYGGEPLLEWDAFRHAVLFAEKMKSENTLDHRTQITSVSNGLLINNVIADFIAEHRVSIGISIDGAADLHNLYRRSSGNRDSFDKAIKGYRTLKDAGAIVGASVTLTPEVVSNFDRVLDFLINEIGVENGLGFNILHYTPNVPVDQNYYDLAAECILTAFRQFRKMSIWEDRIMRKVSAFVEQSPLHGDCAAIGHQIVVAPDGSVGICHDYIKSRENFFANVKENFDPFENPRFIEWSRRSPLRMEECYACPALGICGGGCPASIETTEGSIWQKDTRACPHALRTLEFLVWEACDAQEAQHLLN